METDESWFMACFNAARRDSPGSAKNLEKKYSIFPRFNVARRESPGFQLEPTAPQLEDMALM